MYLFIIMLLIFVLTLVLTIAIALVLNLTLTPVLRIMVIVSSYLLNKVVLIILGLITFLANTFRYLAIIYQIVLLLNIEYIFDLGNTLNDVHTFHTTLLIVVHLGSFLIIETQ